jgi:hypothetical protein
MVGLDSRQVRRALIRRSEARDGSDSPTMARTPFSSPAASIVVSSDGYFDVYPPANRSNGDKPSYRGGLAELGSGIRGLNDRLAVRPDSATLALAVEAWSAVHGGAAVRGELGHGRDGTQPEA